MSNDRHEHLMRILKRLPTDNVGHPPEGQGVERWADPNLAYPDCSGGCRWAAWLWGEDRSYRQACVRAASAEPWDWTGDYKKANAQAAQTASAPETSTSSVP